jgi:CheY-like chemotaxis protein
MKILLVEDDVFFCEMISTFLTKLEHDVVITRDGNEAIEKVHGSQFDLIITDILMPHKGGIDLIEEIRETHPETKILAISSGGRVGHSSFLELAETFGANAILQKPFGALQLARKIEELSDVG